MRVRCRVQRSPSTTRTCAGAADQHQPVSQRIGALPLARRCDLARLLAGEAAAMLRRLRLTPGEVAVSAFLEGRSMLLEDKEPCQVDVRVKGSRLRRGQQARYRVAFMIDSARQPSLWLLGALLRPPAICLYDGLCDVRLLDQASPGRGPPALEVEVSDDGGAWKVRGSLRLDPD